MNKEEDKKPEDKGKSHFVKHSTGAVKKTFVNRSDSIRTRVPTPFYDETSPSSSMRGQESEEKLTIEQFLRERSLKRRKKKEEDILIKEKRTPEKRPTQIQESYPQSMLDSNLVPIKEEMLKSIQNMHYDEARNSAAASTDWQYSLQKCINSYSEKIEPRTYNISHKSPVISKKCSSSGDNTGHSYYLHKTESGQLEFPKNDLTFPKYNQIYEKNYSCVTKSKPKPNDDLKLDQIRLHCPRPYRSSAVKPFKSIKNDSSSYISETSTDDMSLQSYMRGFELEEEKMLGFSTTTASNYPDSQYEEWRDPYEIFGKVDKSEVTPDWLKIDHQMTEFPKKITKSDAIYSNFEIEEASPPNQISGLKSSEELEIEEGEEEEASGSMFSMTSAIRRLDEEVENLNLGSKTADLKSVVVTPRNHFPLVAINIPLSCTPKKLFQKVPENEGKEVKKSEVLEKVEKQKSGLKEVKSSSLKRHSSLFGLKIPKFWKHKPNLESTMKSSKCDLTKKTSPSQAGSSLPAINPNTPTTSKQKSPRKTFENVLPYEVEKFLEVAMKKNIHNTSVTYRKSDVMNRTNTNLNVTELILDDISPPRRYELPKTSQSASSNSTLNRSMSLYRSMSQRIKKKFRPSLKEPVEKPWNPYSRLNLQLDDKLQSFWQQLNIQQTLICQASKALDYCLSMKEFANSSELVESDRLILVANLRKQAILEAIEDFSSKRKSQSSLDDWGEITIKDISFALKEGASRRESLTEDFAEWFVVVVSEGLTVWASHATNCPINSPRICLPGNFSIKMLRSDFKINLKVYSLKIQNITYNHEEKYHIDVEKRSHAICPSPTKLLTKKEKPLTPKSHEVKFSGIRESSFMLTGLLDLELHDLRLTSPWSLTSVPKDSVLKGTVDLSMECKLHLSLLHKGFLTHGDEAGGLAVWNRRWCVLKGSNLMFWNYPGEEEIKDPLLVIDLMYCVSDVITGVDRSLCARSRTFLIEISRHKNARDRNSIVLDCRATCTIIRHFIQCDTTHYFILWMTKLNQVLDTLRKWKVSSKPLTETFL